MMPINLSEIKEFFDSRPNLEPYRSGCELIEDPKRFVESHIAYLETNSGKPGYLPYYNRLLNYYNYVREQTNT